MDIFFSLGLNHSAYVKNEQNPPYTDLQSWELAVQVNGYALRYVQNQTDEICKLAVQQDGYALEYVHNQTDEICKLAVQQNGNVLHLVKKKQMK